ncbi:TlpA family protein disulfide reductase [Flavobacterium zepuense]|uniref:TlpA family protein disulfide reductase n=1 Tax=Flavobacterium zepuense TaxID=2593302 RepID=A0A552UYY4_9FLAO|nr:TlpA disulfide reductase family protein [Flavobacterium zepuense]TRW23412.1 TlpA family protein disulfide reductase [Flavobacterium zepuense]
MYKITLMCLLATVISSCKKEHETPVDKSKTIVTVDYTTDITPDSIVITDTDFKHWQGFKKFSNPLTATFNKGVPHSYTVAFFKNGEHYTGQFWLNNGNPKIKLHFKNKEVVVDTVYNSPIYYELFAFGDQLDAYHKNQDTLTRDKYLLNKIDEHFNDAFSNLASFNYMSYHQNNPEKLRLLLNKIEKQNDSVKYGLSTVYPALQKMLNVSKISNFNPFSYTLMDAKGAVKKPDAGNSKLYLVDFWFVKCKPCVADHKIINQRLKDFKKHSIEVIGISIDQKYEDWSAYLKEHNYSWNNYKQVHSEKNIPADDLGITTYPTYIILNDKGEIVSKRYNYITDVIADYIDTK